MAWCRRISKHFSAFWLIATTVVWVSIVPANAGSLYDQNSYKALVTDHKAQRVGDSITVLIFEDASASASTDTDTAKSASANLNGAIDVDLLPLQVDGRDHLKTGLGMDSDFSGNGTMTRAGKLKARVSVVILDVLPNGEFVVGGSQEIGFNNESQEISISGRVRPEDISSSNTVLSTRLSNSKITYKGEGLLSNREKPGIFTRFLNWLF